MSMVVRRACALVLLAGAVAAAIALPRILVAGQRGDRMAFPHSAHTTTLRVHVPGLPLQPRATPQAIVSAPRLAAAPVRPIARRVAPRVQPRAPVVRAIPVSTVKPASSVAPAAASNPTPATASAPAVAQATADQTAVHVIASTLEDTVPAASDPASARATGKHGDRADRNRSDHGSTHGNDNADHQKNDHRNDHGSTGEHGNGHAKGR